MSSATPLVHGLIQRRSINLIIGSSGSGKSNLILPQLNSYAAGEQFFGYRLGSPPEQLGAIVCSRTMDDSYYHVSDLHLEHLMRPKVFPIHKWKPAYDVTDRQAIEAAYDDLCRHANSPVKLLLVDGLQRLMSTGKSTDQHSVSEFFNTLHEFCSDHDATILGTVGTAKMKKGEYYPLLADRIYGSIIWGHESSTLIGVEQVDLHLPVERRSSLRRVILQSSVAPPSVRYADFNERGQMVLIERPDAKEVESESPAHAILYRRLDVVAPGAQMKKEVFVDWGNEANMSLRTVERWLAIASHEDIGLLVRSGNTKTVTYTKPVMN